MQNRILLVSDDFDFFEYICTKLRLRKKDELFRFGFDDIPENLDIVVNSLLIINAEQAYDKTIDLLNLIKGTPAIVFNYNDNEEYRKTFFKSGCFSYITLFTPDEEFDSIVASGLNMIADAQKKNMYRELLVQKGFIEQNNEVFLNCNEIIENELKRINKNKENAVLIALSPNEKAKFLIKPSMIETVILNNIRKSDILMSFAAGKYFLLLNNVNLDDAKNIWSNIKSNLSENIYAGFVQVNNSTREQLVNSVLNKLHEAINKDFLKKEKKGNTDIVKNFKIYREEFNKNFEKILTPVFYHFQQKYYDKFLDINVDGNIGDGFGTIILKSRKSEGILNITAPGCTKINIDIKYTPAIDTNDRVFPAAKRINIEPQEFESSVLEEILEQFMLEFKEEVKYEYT